MVRVLSWLILIQVLLSSVCIEVDAQAYRSRTIALNFNQYPAAGGGLEYSLQTFYALTAPGVDNPAVKLIAPNGIEFPSINHEIFRSSFEEVAAMSFGEWTAVETYPTTPITEFTFKFQMPAFDHASVARGTPFIIAPADGAVVPEDFQIAWNSGNSSGLNGIGMWTQRSNYSFQSDLVDVPNCCITHVNGRLDGPGIGSLQVRVNAESNVQQPFLVDNPATQNDRFFLRAGYQAHSSLSSFTIVPEPSSVLIAFAVGLCSVVTKVRIRVAVPGSAR